MSVYYKDSPKQLQESIESTLNQSFNNFKLFLICDGVLTDRLNLVIQSIQDHRVKIFFRNSNLGLAKSLNELIGEILSYDDCEFIARMDADDISLPSRFEKQIQYLKFNTSVDCLGTWAIEIKNDGTEYYRKEMPTNHNGCLELFKKRDCLIHPTVMFRKSYFDKAGLYPEDTYFGEDTIMWAQGFANGCVFANIPEFLFKFRLDDNFFERRRGVKHAKSIISLRSRVNKMLGFGFKEYLYAYLYAFAKLMPTNILNFIYKKFR